IKSYEIDLFEMQRRS
ncbi:hypothetical protein HNY73_011594, partial [Argiope bruennichi]